MKHFLPVVWCALLLVGCASSPPTYTTTLDDQYKDGIVSVSLVGLDPDGSPSPQGLTVQCMNTGTSPVTVQWEKSTISLGSAPHPVFLKYGSYGDPRGAPADVNVPAGERLVETVYPANRVTTMSGGWGPLKLDIQPLGAERVSLSISVNVLGQDRFYTLQVQMQ